MNEGTRFWPLDTREKEPWSGGGEGGEDPEGQASLQCWGWDRVSEAVCPPAGRGVLRPLPSESWRDRGHCPGELSSCHNSRVSRREGKGSRLAPKAGGLVQRPRLGSLQVAGARAILPSTRH